MLHFGSSFESHSTLWIECCNLIFLTLLVKALTLVASSCNSESHYPLPWWEFTIRTNTHTHKMPFCLYSSTNIDSFLLGRVTAKCSFGGFRTIIVLLTFHTLFVSRCYGWEVPISVSFLMGLALASPLSPYLPHCQPQWRMAQRGMTWRVHCLHCLQKGKEDTTERKFTILFMLSVFVIVWTNLLKLGKTHCLSILVTSNC